VQLSNFLRNFYVNTIRLGRNFLYSDFGKCLLIITIWHLSLLCIGVFSEKFFLDKPGELLNLFTHTTNWDSGWYFGIIENGYIAPGSTAFYPLFPFLLSGIDFITGGQIDLKAISFFVNFIASWLAIVALLKITTHFVPKLKWWAIAFFLALPSAFFLHLFYTEALFCAVVFWAYYCALQKKWWLMGVLLAFATATRLPSILFLGLCALEYLRYYKWNIIEALNKNILWFFIAPIGFIVYGCYLQLTGVGFLGMFSAYQATTDWAYQVFNPNVIETIGRSIKEFGRILILDTHSITITGFVNTILPVLAILLLAAASIYSLVERSRKLIPLGIFGLVSLIFFTLNSNIVSVHRYILPCIVIYIALVSALFKFPALRYVFIPLLYGSILLQCLLYIMFIQAIFVG
jgi:Gpi18-like mannosyltransferase